jgi:23S rRNA pseudouridine2605 synthase
MRDRPHPNHKLEWPGGVVPEWARPQQNANRRFGKGRKGPGGERQGGSSPSKRERLQKVMAQSGHGSRRNIEILIAQGHITINGQVAKLGDSVGPGDKVKLDGKLLNLRYGEALPRVLLYHKVAGEIVTRDDPEKRPTVFDKLPKVHGGRWVSVGRLDFNTEGLLIFTTSGELANRLTHPRFEVEREYAVRVVGELSEEQKAKLLTGVEIDGESCKFDSLEDRGGEGTNHWYHVTLREGKNREVRRMMEAVGLTVSRLMRVRFGSVELPSFLKRGMMREMDEAATQDLLAFAGMQDPPAAAAAGEEEVEDEHDNIGNRAPEGYRDPRIPHDAPEEHDEHDNVGNRFDPRSQSAERPDIGNRAGPHRPDAPLREPDGNRGSYDFNRPEGKPNPNQRRAHGGKPFAFGKKRGQGRGPQGQPGQGAPQGQFQGKHRKHGQPKPHPQGQGQGQQGQQANGAGQGPRPQGQGQGPAAGPGKPGRHRRHKNRNRNRGEAGANPNPQADNSGNREPGNSGA